MFRPDFFISAVTEITPQFLQEQRIELLLLDVDCTLKRYDEELPSEEVLTWLNGLKDAGFLIHLISNGRGPRIRKTAELLNLPCLAPAGKPFPHKLRRAIKERGGTTQTTMMVGDQIFTDILAAKLAAVRTVLVRPICPELEPWFARMKRGPERWLYKKWGYDRVED